MTTAQVATRLSCFALISAIEEDLRRESSQLAEILHRSEILPPDVRERAAKRWNEDHRSIQVEAADTDIDLLDYTDFADLAKILYGLADPFSNLKNADIKPIATKLEQLAPIRNRVCHSRPLEADDFNELYDFAESLRNSREVGLWIDLTATLKMLQENPRSVLTLAIPKFWSADLSTIPHNLPLPDFDDTGFLGRPKDRKEVSAHLLSPHPVVTIVGEGGVGKTALALRCLYDLLDTPERSRFDAIVWISLKTKALTASGVSEIEDSIKSILGLVHGVAGELGIPHFAAQELNVLLDNIAEYLETFKILLAIDNLETLSWQTIRPLLVKLPLGSKVLITSRIGLGEIELRYSLDPLDVRTSVALARRHARSLNLKHIYEAEEQTLNTICNRLYNNPLLIKWFVSSVAAGADPRTLINHHTPTFQSALSFCFENLFVRLSDLEKHICQVLAASRRSLVPAELYYLLRHVKRDDIDWAMNTLHQSSMIKRTFVKQNDGLSTEYTLSEIATEYIKYRHAPSVRLFEMVQQQLKELRQIVEAETILHAAYKYDVFAIQVSSKEERIAAAYLRRALKEANNRDFQQARREIAEAKALVPGSSEVFRVSGLVESMAENYFDAASELDTSIALDPKSSLAQYTYSQQLIRLDDFDGALGHIEGAVKLDPKDPTLRTTKALVLTRLGRYAEAAELYESVLPTLKERTKKWRLSTRDQAAECYRRWADQDRRLDDQPARLQHLKRSLGILEQGFGENDVDSLSIKRFGRVVDELFSYAIRNDDLMEGRVAVEALVRHRERYAAYGLEMSHLKRFRALICDDAELSNQLEGLALLEEDLESIEEEANRQLSSAGVISAKVTGSVARLVPGTHFGFIVDDQGQDWFFHHDQLERPQEWRDLKAGRMVRFRIGRNVRGPCAKDVELVKT
jgi:LuxR family transcriptional regulator, glucitol operon activator